MIVTCCCPQQLNKFLKISGWQLPARPSGFEPDVVGYEMQFGKPVLENLSSAFLV